MELPKASSSLLCKRQGTILQDADVRRRATIPLLCCFRAQKDEEMAKLHSIVDLLKDELNALKKSTHNADQRPPLAPGTGQPTVKDSLPSIYCTW